MRFTQANYSTARFGIRLRRQCGQGVRDCHRITRAHLQSCERLRQAREIGCRVLANLRQRRRRRDALAGAYHRHDQNFSRPRVGFIVTNLSRPAEWVVAFYNKRGTAGQWINEGTGAIKWTHLSCRTFAANAVRL